MIQGSHNAGTEAIDVDLHTSARQQPGIAAEGLAGQAEGAYSSTWLMGLKLLAVQPACLKAHPLTALQQQQQQQFNQAGAAVGQLEPPHTLLVHLEATLASDSTAAPAGHVAGTAALGELSNHATGIAAAPSPPYPLQLQHAVLELVVLTRQMQLLQQQRVSLLQLVLQQEQQQLQQPPLEPRPDAASGSAGRYGSSSSSSSTWPVLLNVHTSMPSEPTDRLLDCLHLVLMITSSGGQQQLAAGTSSAAAEETPAIPAPPGPAGAVVADVPLLLLPAAAQQEVQQLLLPAMRQEVQAEQQLQQHEHAGMQAVQPGQLAGFAHAVLQVEHAAWQHYCQLANDMYAVMQLSLAAEAAAASDVDAGGVGADVVFVDNGATSPAAGGGLSAPAAALAQLSETVLFPLLLPFLAAQGLHSTLHLLLLTLPEELRQQWEVQQLARLQQLTDNAPPAVQLPVVAEEEELEEGQQQQQQQQEIAAVSGPGDLEHREQEDDAAAAAAAAEKQTEKAAAAQQWAESSKAAAGKAATRGEAATAAAAAAEEQAASSAADNWVSGNVAAAVAAGVPWYLPFTHFADGDAEQSYLAWKHHTLLQVDYLAALFEVLYLAVLLRRMLTEPVTVFYFLFILLKTLPHLPLMLGARRCYLRYRELWLLLVAPVTALIAFCLALPSVCQGKPPMLLPNRAYKAYWSSRGELQTNILRPFMQHMRLRPFIVYTLTDAAISVWVFAQVFGVWAAVERWCFAVAVSLCLSWGLDFYLRRRFVQAMGRQLRLQQEHQHVE